MVPSTKASSPNSKASSGEYRNTIILRIISISRIMSPRSIFNNTPTINYGDFKVGGPASRDFGHKKMTGESVTNVWEEVDQLNDRDELRRLVDEAARLAARAQSRVQDCESSDDLILYRVQVDYAMSEYFDRYMDACLSGYWGADDEWLAHHRRGCGMTDTQNPENEYY